MAFVKFLRGTQTAFDNLTKKDSDTLYFIYTDNTATKGKLYLGDKLIGGAGEGTTIANLSDLEDIKIDDASSLVDGALLQYDAKLEHKWKPVSIKTAIENSGADIGSSVAIGKTKEGQSIEDALNELVENPEAGRLAVVDGEAYVYDGENWISLTQSFEDRVSSLEESVGTPADSMSETPATGLFADIEGLEDRLDNTYTKDEVNARIAEADHLSYEKINDLAEADLTASNKVYLVPKAEAGTDDAYDEYLVQDGALEKIGSWTSGTIDAAHVTNLTEAIQEAQLIKNVQSGVLNIDENGLLTLTSVPNSVLNFNPDTFALKSEVGDLSSLINPSKENTTIVDEINDLKTKLTWQEIN